MDFTCINSFVPDNEVMYYDKYSLFTDWEVKDVEINVSSLKELVAERAGIPHESVFPEAVVYH